MKLSHVPLRVTAASYILHQGFSKLQIDEEAARGLHGYAASGVPEVAQMEPMTFARLLRTGEIALGTALLLPFVPARLAGAALTAFAAGLLRFYLNAPGMRQEGSLRPSEQGEGVAKDVWLLGMGLALLIDSGRSRKERSEDS